MSHNSLKDSLVVYGNDALWNQEEREALIERAVEIYLRKRRKTAPSRQDDSLGLQQDKLQEGDGGDDSSDDGSDDDEFVAFLDELDE